ncbi:hypothetical protein [Pseudoalteromonas luteoviolacea]|uniref:Membrane transport protein MMPL domain-containing protein n=1 Tax=Pseudoalteromonas luteoviolacea NCIMB 1942 TaxID=1365253 RepID=A0A162AEZ6_9GAMM|nr:hypothetical protein [Pseudoalteromonas luteoviolacea]KZN48623.1 hypothetical protein N482_07260 [Pseudoalteromonas luteoviolacea NCIMB 1942]
MPYLSKKQHLPLGLAQLIIAVSLLVYLLVQGKVNLEADILSLLPSEDIEFVNKAEGAFFQRYKNNVMIAFSGQDAKSAHDDVRTGYDEKGWLYGDFSFPELEAVAKLFGAYQGYLLDGESRQALTEGDSLGEAALAKLNNAFDPFTPLFFPFDPTLTTASFVQTALVQQASNLTVEDGRMVVNDDTKYYVLMLTLPLSELESMEKATDLVYAVSESLAHVEAEYPNVITSYSGIPFHTAENMRQANKEMRWLGGVSAFFIVLIVLWSFRSINALFAVLITQLNAVCFGLLALTLLYDSVHVITLVFSITLIGIAIDYSFHVMTTKKDDSIAYSNVRSAVKLGCVSTATGYCAFMLLPMEALEQVGIFIAFGLVGALCSALFIIPSILHSYTGQSRLNQLGDAVVSVLNDSRGATKVVLSLFGLLSVVFVVTNEQIFNDDIALLNASSETLRKNELKHQQWYFGTQSQRLILWESNLEALLEKEEALVAALKSQSSSIKVQAISNWLPSKSRQQENLTLLVDAQNRGDFATLAELVGQPIEVGAAPHLTLDALLESELGELLSSQYLKLHGYHVSLVYVNHAAKHDIDTVLDNFVQITRVDKAEQLSLVLVEMRQSLLIWFAIALSVFLLVLCMRFDLISAVKSGFWLLLSCLIGLSGSLLLQGSLNLFNLLALVLLVALAIDYFIFYLKCGQESSTALAISLSALSSVFVFGMLSFSQTPAIYSFGYTIMIGIVSIYFVAPLVVKRKA